MGHASPVVDEVLSPKVALRPRAEFHFHSLVITDPERLVGRRSFTLGVSLVLHSLLVLAAVVLPLLFYDMLPNEEVLKTFFVAPLEVAPPPPPPPPPAPGPRSITKAPPKAELTPTTSFMAPIDVPAEIRPEEGLSLGVEGGVAGGVEGGVPGGVVGGVVGGLLTDAPPPPPKVVRIGGQLVAPKIIRKVTPVFPELAVQSRVSATVFLEAEVDTRGYVKTVRVLRGHPLFDDAAIDAVKQWRYMPLLLNGEPTGFILTVTVGFNLQAR